LRITAETHQLSVIPKHNPKTHTINKMVSLSTLGHGGISAHFNSQLGNGAHGAQMQSGHGNGSGVRSGDRSSKTGQTGDFEATRDRISTDAWPPT
jgi:hypothetical protein